MGGRINFCRPAGRPAGRFNVGPEKQEARRREGEKCLREQVAPAGRLGLGRASHAERASERERETKES